MDQSFTYLVQGLALGAAAGILPGPVMMFILSQVIKNGSMAGIRVQFGATFLDIVRIIIVFFLFSKLPQNPTLIGVIALIGGLFLLYTAYRNFTYKSKMDTSESDQNTDEPFLQGMMGNILNPASYIFWLTVGGPILLAAKVTGSIMTILSFVFGFLLFIFIISVLIVFLADKAKAYLRSNLYIYIIKALGLVLVIFSVSFFKQAYQYLIVGL